MKQGNLWNHETSETMKPRNYDTMKPMKTWNHETSETMKPRNLWNHETYETMKPMINTYINLHIVWELEPKKIQVVQPTPQ